MVEDKRQLALSLSIFCLLSAGLRAQSTWYVDSDAPGPARDGLTWCTAFVDLQDGLLAAQSGHEIKVAAGAYRPDRGTGDRLATFPLKSGVALRGGYAGCGQPNPDARDYALYPTALSGDLTGNDGPDFANYAENSYHVVTYDNPIAVGVLLEGFTVSGGNADGTSALTNQGGGIHIRRGLIKCLAGGPTIRDCIIEKNFASHHGAVNDHGLRTIIENCVIRDNRAGIEGAGLQVHSGSPVISNSTFINNVSDGEGGGAWIGTDIDATCSGASTATFENCTFEDNRAFTGGGVFATGIAASQFKGCTFRTNIAFTGAGMYFENAAGSTIRDCVFLQNAAESEGGGTYNNNSHPTYIDCTFIENAAGIYAGAVRNRESNPLLTGCVFVRNSSQANGGAIHDRLSNPILDRCVFAENTATLEGAAIFNIQNSSPVIRNSLFVGNSTPRFGGALQNHEGSFPELSNCTIYANSAVRGGSACDNDEFSGILLTNSIVWNNAGVVFSGVGPTTATYSNIEGGFAGEGNVASLPAFLDADGPDQMPGTLDDDLRLALGSPSVNAGDPGASIGEEEQDLAGGDRLVGCRVDMGAYESATLQSPGDFNGDLLVDLRDFAHFQLLFFNPVQRSAWQQTYLCVFDADSNGFLDLNDHALLPWGFGRCDEEGEVCDDGEECNGVEICIGGVCRPGTPKDCDDGNVCTDDGCAHDTCTHVNNAAECDDGNACTADDRCSGGSCGGAPVVCDDHNPCTFDSCSPASGCVHPPNDSGQCDDGNLCNGLETCSGGLCLTSGPLLCNDENLCTDDSCDPQLGCVFDEKDGRPCDDSNACTLDDACLGGQCQGGAAVDCSHLDGPCTMGACDPGGVEGNCASVPRPDGTPCDLDASVCTVERCNGFGICYVIEEIECPGSFACDGGQTCDPASGDCVDNDDPVGIPCNTDENLCTIEACDGVGGCVFIESVVCPGPIGQCDGGQQCDPATGACVDTPDPAAGPCEKDGNLCTIDECNGKGDCVLVDNVACPGPSGVCDGGQTCDPKTGACVPGPYPAGTPCHLDLDLCTIDVCDGQGNCVFDHDVACEGPQNECDGGQRCDPNTGLCRDRPDRPFGTRCTQDEDLCTEDECDGKGGCVVGPRCENCDPKRGCLP